MLAYHVTLFFHTALLQKCQMGSEGLCYLRSMGVQLLFHGGPPLPSVSSIPRPSGHQGEP